MSVSRILVTGAGGFIGRNLANYLADQGCDVIGIDLHYPNGLTNGQAPRFRAVPGDFRNQELLKRSLQGVDVLFHLASAHLAVKLNTSEYWDINVRSLIPLLEMAQRSGVRRFIHVSSVGIYGRLQTCPAAEDTPCHPQSIYGQTKWAGEQAVRAFAQLNRYPVIVLRPAWVYGTGCPRTAKIYRALCKRRFFMIGPCRNLRHPLYIVDFLKACELAMRNDVGFGEAFIVAGETPVTSQELIETFCSTLDLPRPSLRVPYRLGRWVAGSVEAMCSVVGREPPISRRTLEFFDTDNAFDISRARRQLGYQPQYSLVQGLQEMKPWLRQLASNNISNSKFSTPS